VFALGKWDGFTNQITQSHLAHKQTEVLMTLHLQSLITCYYIYLDITFRMKELYAKEYAEFITVTCLDWKLVLSDARFKDIIVDSLNYLSKEKRIWLYAFVIMNNHFHLIWQMVNENKRDSVQRDFLKFTGQQILMKLKVEKPDLYEALRVNAKDRTYQVWQRNSLGIPLWTPEVFWQKIDYIHNNPVKAGLCKYPEDYKYSSARFYLTSEKEWKFLVHFEG
jgi:REP element-mobilizing transposase RayT